ncbi:MAG: hypothetical protein AAFR31_11020 [Cyanobacteria bacterium J06627_8]
MSQLDLFILVVYTITVIIVVTRAIDSLDKKTTISFDDAPFKEKLEQYGLADKLAVKFAFDKRYALMDHPSKLSLTLENKLEDAVYVDWDRSSIAEPGGRSRRAIRLTPYGSPDLSKAQVYTVIPPGSSVKETITAEGCLTSDSENPEILKPTQSLMSMAAVQKNKKLFGAFLAEKAALVYTVWLVVQTGEIESTQRGDRLYVLPCNIVTKKVPWTDSLPWKG